MIILILGLLALFLLPHPWNEVAFAAAFGWEITTILFALWYSQRGRAQVGSETLIGQPALVTTACFPTVWGAKISVLPANRKFLATRTEFWHPTRLGVAHD